MYCVKYLLHDLFVVAFKYFVKYLQLNLNKATAQPTQ